jgi:lysophospholipase L1-like esterase
MSRLAATATLLLTMFTGCRADTASPSRSLSFHRVLFLGNSITEHGPSPSIGWTGSWGMAASSAANDYAHVLTAAIPGSTLDVRNISSLETDPAHFVPASIDSSLAKTPDLVVVELGDNATDVAGFRSAYGALIAHLTAMRVPEILCVSTWWHSVEIDRAIVETCLAANARYADISGLYPNSINRALAERSFPDPGVGIHPGDRGMQAIADVLLNALTKSAPASP